MPPSLKLKEGGKFPLKAISRGVIPNAVIDRPKGYFPVPALKFHSTTVTGLTWIKQFRCNQRSLINR